MGAEVFHALQKVLKARGLSTAVGDEGGFAPKLDGVEDALDCIIEAIRQAGYRPGDDVRIAMDCAASEFCVKGDDGKFYYDYSRLKNGMTKAPNGKRLSDDEQIAYLEQLITKYPIDSIEDGMSEEDWKGWKKLTERIGSRCQLVGDDLFVTNVKFLRQGIERGCANSILIKVNQIGSLSETLDAIEMAHRHGYTTVTFAPLGRDGGCHHCRHRRGHQQRADKDRLAEPLRPHGQVQPAAAHRGRAGRTGRLRLPAREVKCGHGPHRMNTIATRAGVLGAYAQTPASAF